MTVTQFATRILKCFAEEEAEPILKLSVYLPNAYKKGIYNKRILPLKVICHHEDSTTPLGFNKLLDIFGKVPYIHTNKQLAGDFMRMDIYTDKKKVYNEHEYYDSSIHVLNLNEEQKETFTKLHERVQERAHEWSSVTYSLTLEDFAEL